MKKLTFGMAALLAIATTGWAQNLAQIHSRPSIPSPEILAKHNLALAWRTHVPMDGLRDGIHSVQVLHDQILIQTRSGAVVAINPSDGATQWRARLGAPYRVSTQIGYNAKLVFIVNGNTLYTLDRLTGQFLWEFAMPSAPSATPTADDQRLFLCLGTGRIYVFALPQLSGTPGQRSELTPAPSSKPTSVESYRGVRGQALASVGPLSSAGQASRSRASGPQPILLFESLTPARLEQTPLLSHNLILLAGSDGSFFAMQKDSRVIMYRFQADAPLSAPAGPHEEMGYFPSQDYNIYALDILQGRILWRFAGGAPILIQPQVTDDDIFVSPVGAGMYRLNRLSGEMIWRNLDAHRFLATNNKFVYATDKQGRMLILDYARGTTLGTVDTHEFVVPMSNDWTDRVYLASNDGLLVCLRDRDLTKIMRVRRQEVKPAEKAPAPPKAPPKAANKPEDKMPDKE